MFQLRKCSAGAKGVFIERRPRSKYAEKQVGKSTGCGEKPLSSYVTPHSLATRMRHSSDAGIGTKNRGKRILGGLECLPPLGLPPDSYFHTAAQRTWPLTPLATTLQCSCCLAKPVLNCARIGRYNRCPMPCHVAAGVDSPNPSLLGPSLNHPLTRYFLLHAAAACA